MPLAVNRAGVVFKKCDRAAHRPDTNKACASDTCQHTCSDIERCPHAWTLRYWVNGKQRERSFKDQVGGRGRVQYGSGKRLAVDAQLKLTHDKRAEGVTFVDHAKTGRENFGQACDRWIDRLPVGPTSKENYRTILNAHIRPVLGDRTVAQVAGDRDAVVDLLTGRMGHLSYTRRTAGRMIIVGTVDEAVKAGRLARHRLDGIELYDDGRKTDRSGFVFPAHAQVEQVAGAVGISVWLMRGCGLRIEEALAVHKSDFIEGGRTLRLTGQASNDGRERRPLKHRKRGEYRDVPVPAWLRDKVKDLPLGPLTPGNGDRPYRVYGTVLAAFQRAAKAAGIPAGFNPHSLRHAYVSALLSRGVPLTDIAPWVGHRDISKLYKVYGHLLPSAQDRALAVLASEYAEWSNPQDEPVTSSV
jgi:integrase